MSDTLYERYDTGEDDTWDIGKSQLAGIYGQSFTVGNTGANQQHTITSIKFKLSRKAGVPGVGNMVVTIYAVDISGFPTGAALCTSDNLDSTTIASGAAAFYEFIFSSPATLNASTQYAAVMTTGSYDGTNWVLAAADSSSPSYTGGVVFKSADGGATWGGQSSDFMFDEYGLATSVSLTSPLATINIQGLVPTLKVFLTSALATLNIQGLLPTIRITGEVWNNQSKNASSATNQSKNTSSATNQSKHSSTFINQQKS